MIASANKQIIAYIDGANLHKRASSQNISLDYRRLYVWLREKLLVRRAIIFLGHLLNQTALYEKLVAGGYEISFKTITRDRKGRVKGNCDADLVLKVAQDFYENRLSKAVLVSSDGDFHTLVAFLKERCAFLRLLSPSEAKECLILLKQLGVPITYLNEIQRHLK